MKTKITVLRHCDITKLKVDAIVNAANRSLLGGGGVDGAIHRAAGPQLLEECRALGGAKTGEAKATSGYNLPAKFIIHSVGPVWSGGRRGEDELLAIVYKNSLNEAKRVEAKTIAFPNISTGVYRFPKKRAAKIVIETVLGYLKENEEFFNEIIFCIFDDENYFIYEKVLKEYVG